MIVGLAADVECVVIDEESISELDKLGREEFAELGRAVSTVDGMPLATVSKLVVLFAAKVKVFDMSFAADVAVVVALELVGIDDDDSAELETVLPETELVAEVLLLTGNDVARRDEVTLTCTDADAFKDAVETLLATVRRLVVLLAARLNVLVVLLRGPEDAWLVVALFDNTVDVLEVLV